MDDPRIALAPKDELPVAAGDRENQGRALPARVVAVVVCDTRGILHYYATDGVANPTSTRNS